MVPVTVLKNKHHVARNRKEQETLDYIEAMRILHGLGCSYPTLLEDDAMADEHWTDKMREVAGLLEDGRDWITVRIYTGGRKKPEGRLVREIPGWGTVAIIFSRQYLLKIADDLEQDFLTSAVVEPKDVVLLNLIINYGIPSYAFYPVVFQHTGFLIRPGLDARPRLLKTHPNFKIL